jgi:hypothetical protein
MSRRDWNILAPYFGIGAPRKAKPKATPKPRERAADRKARELAKPLAERIGCDLERIDGGLNVWPPASLADTARDPYEGDHYAADWPEALAMLQAYAAIVDGAETK